MAAGVVAGVVGAAGIASESRHSPVGEDEKCVWRRWACSRAIQSLVQLCPLGQMSHLHTATSTL